MAIPDYLTLMLPVLRLAAKGEQRVADVADRVADDFGLSAEERETLLPSGRQRVLNNRIHWAKFYMSRAGLISSPGRGRFVATDEGRKLLATNPDQISVALLMKQPSFREFYETEREPPPTARRSRSRRKLLSPTPSLPRSRSRLLTKPYNQFCGRTSCTASLKIPRRSSSRSSSICSSLWATAGPTRTQRLNSVGPAMEASTE
jgi:hypothetical protein